MRVAAYATWIVTTGAVATGVLGLAACGGPGAPLSLGPAKNEVPAPPSPPESLVPAPSTSVRTLDLVGVALDSQAHAPLGGVFVHGHHAYVGGLRTDYARLGRTGIRILDLSDPMAPELVGNIPLRRTAFSHPLPFKPAEYGHAHGDAVVTSIDTAAFHGDVAVVLNGLPDDLSPEDYPQTYGVWDVTDAREPRFLSAVNVGGRPSASSYWERLLATGEGDLGDRPDDSKAVGRHHFYTLYSEGESGVKLGIVDLSDPRHPMVAGNWSNGDEVLLVGLSFNHRATRAYAVGVTPHPYGESTEMGVLYVLDVQDPANPVEIGRYLFDSRRAAPYAVPNEDDSLVILADGGWGITPVECDLPHGILHVLDVSDLESIHEVSSFAIEETDVCDLRGKTRAFQAKDIVVRGDLVYSTWLAGGLRVIDISDPTMPVEVGRFDSPQKETPWLLDLALYGDLVVTTTVWYSGLYVVR